MAEVKRILDGNKLEGKPLSTSEFKLFTELSVLYWVIIESFLGHNVKDKTEYNRYINHNISLLLITIMVH